MDLNKISLFNAKTQRLNWLSQRQSVLAQNIANANTPNYKPQDLKEPDFSAMLSKSREGSLVMAQTRDGHLGGGASQAVNYKTFATAGQETTPTGNAVILEEQFIKTSETRMSYTTILSLYRKHVDMIKTALGSGR